MCKPDESCVAFPNDIDYNGFSFHLEREETVMLPDYHLHTDFSGDSTTPPRAQIERAIQLGMDSLCITDHHDYDVESIIDFNLDLDPYMSSLTRLQEEYKDRIDVRIGIELGLQMHLSDYFYSLLAETPFDFIIGSSHLVHGYDPYYPEFFEGRKEFYCYMEYFESILENISVYDGFDVYGHIDYVVRYGPEKNRQYSYGRYKDILDEILKRLIFMGKGIELNTGGDHYGLGEPNPCVAVIRRYRELGGEIITIGADAHTPDKVAYAFDRAACVLEDCGFRYYTVFKNRHPEFISL